MSAFPKRTVYLCGPITGLTYGDARHSWRKHFPSLLPEHIFCLSPMRGAELMHKNQVLMPKAEYDSQHIIENPRGILTRDENDIRTCDLMVANFLGAPKPSIGSICEFGMARVLRKPVVLVMEKDGSNVHTHGFITEIACYWVDSLEDAAEVTTTLLTPGT